MPQRVGRYRVLDEIAQGGMATVFLAAADGPAGYEKLVALKKIHPHLAKDPRHLAMFLDEARLAARLVHPNVCGVIDFGEAQGEYFLAMDYLTGAPVGSLARAVARSPELRMSSDWLRVVGRIVLDAAEGLHAAHELRDESGALLGVVHRDVSPQNLFVGFDGITRVVDFGVAAFADRIHHTQTGEVKGKLAYMAPEQVKQLEPDRRMDVWALAVVAWELLTMRRLFRRDGTAATLYGVLEDRIDLPSTVNSSLPSSLDQVVMQALERDRDKRTPSAREFADKLAKAIESAGVRIASPAEVGILLSAAIPDAEVSGRRRLVAARERLTEEHTSLSVAAPAPKPTRSWMGMAMGAAGIAVLLLLGGVLWKGAAGAEESAPTTSIPSIAIPGVPSALPAATARPTFDEGVPVEVTPVGDLPPSDPETPAAVPTGVRRDRVVRPRPRADRTGRTSGVDLTTEW